MLNIVVSFSIQSLLTQVHLLQILGSYNSHDPGPTQLDKFLRILFQFSRYSLQMSAAGIELLHPWLRIDSLTHLAMARSLYQSRNCIFPTNKECFNDSDPPQKKNCIVRLSTQYRKPTIDLMYKFVEKQEKQNLNKLLIFFWLLDMQGIESWTPRMRSGCDTTTPHARWVKMR